jgi:hypothetical protein
MYTSASAVTQQHYDAMNTPLGGQAPRSRSKSRSSSRSHLR